jgi:hypothetical protein
MAGRHRNHYDEDFKKRAVLRHVMRFYWLPATAAVFLFVQCHSSAMMKSAWPKNKIIIDGAVSDWEGMIHPVTDEPFGVGIANDDSSFYVCLLSEERKIARQVMRFGLTIWFENPQSKHSRWGIRFPMGIANSAGDLRGMREHGDSETIRRTMEESLGAMEVIGPGKADTVPMGIAVAEKFGMQLKAAAAMEKFVYELRIPLHADSSAKYALPFSKDSLTEVVLESSAPEPGNSNEELGQEGQMGNGAMRGGGGGFGGGRGSGGGHHMGGHGSRGGGGYHGSHHEPAEPFTVELAVKLAHSK